MPSSFTKWLKGRWGGGSSGTRSTDINGVDGVVLNSGSGRAGRSGRTGGGGGGAGGAGNLYDAAVMRAFFRILAFVEDEQRVVEEGIYRIPGAASEYDKICAEVMSGKGVQDLSIYQLHSVCSSVKSILRESQPLLDKDILQNPTPEGFRRWIGTFERVR